MTSGMHAEMDGKMNQDGAGYDEETVAKKVHDELRKAAR